MDADDDVFEVVDADEDVHWEEEEDIEETGSWVGTIDITGFEQVVVNISVDVWHSFLDISTMLR